MPEFEQSASCSCPLLFSAESLLRCIDIFKESAKVLGWENPCVRLTDDLNTAMFEWVVVRSSNLYERASFWCAGLYASCLCGSP